MPGTWKTVRLFLSSTFRDMHAERDHLIKVTFPAVREKLLPYRVELYDIDLRWGITEEEARHEKVISLCLEQVDECRPFFLAFLGHRYGWVPGEVPLDTRERFPFVRRLPDVSVTELELRHGLRAPAEMHALVLFRDEEAVRSVPEALRRQDYQEADPQRQAQLAALEQELRAGPWLVRKYSAAWDPQRYDRVTRTRGRLAHLDAFGKQVEDWLWEAIRTHLQLPDTPAEVDPFALEADLHERFLEVRTRIYIGRQDLYRELRSFALADGETPLLLTGESGLGKSAALARFVRDFRQEHADVFVLPHFVGASPRTTSLGGMLRRLTQELQQKFDLQLPEARSTDEILGAFLTALGLLPASARVLLVLDGLNQLDPDRRVDSLVWLPERLPPNVRVLCSCISSQQTSPLLTAFGKRPHIKVALEPLEDDERRAIVRAVPKLVAKTLDDRQLEALLANPATRNPLFLMVALEELRGFGSFEQLNDMINRLPRGPSAVTQLFDQVLARLEEEFSRPVVEWALGLLACSKRGLAEQELVALTQPLGEQAEDLYPVLRQLRPYLQNRDGLLDFYHASIRRAVEVRYLRWHEEDGQRDPWERWNPRRPRPAAEPTEPEQQTRERLVEEFSTQWLGPRAIDELPWQLAQLRDWPRLRELLGDLTFFDAAWEANEVDVRTAWSLMKQVGGLEPIEVFGDVLSYPSIHDRDALWRLAQFLQDSGDSQAALQLWEFLGNAVNEATARLRLGDLDGALQLLQEQGAIYRQHNDQASLALCLGNLALIRKATGNLDEARQLLQEQEAICQRLNNPAGLQGNLGNQAAILLETGNLDGAMQLLAEQEAICRRIDDPVSLATCLGNQALIRKITGDLNAALRLHREEEAICRRLNDPDGLQRSLGNQAMIHKMAGDLEEALRLHREEEAICRQMSDPAALGGSLGNQALVLRDIGNPDGAMKLFEEQEAICRRLEDRAGLGRCRGNQGLILLDRGDLDGALQRFREQEETCRQLHDLDGLQHSLGNQASIPYSRGDFGEALRLLEQQEAICRQLDDPDGLQRCLGNQAMICQAVGDVSGALRLLEEQEAVRGRLHLDRGGDN
jgi:tetratricopeptide (TPR) repeat protein